MSIVPESEWEPLQIAEVGPREVRTAPATLLGERFLIAIIPISFLVMCSFGFRVVGTMKRLRDAGKVVSGRVTGMSVHESKSTTYEIDYEFDPGDGHGTLDDHETVSQGEYAQYSYSSPVTVTYLPEHPATHIFGSATDERVNDLQTVWTGLSIGIPAVFAIIFVVLIVDVRRQKGMLSSYVARRAYLDNVGPPTGKYSICQVTYRYRDLNDKLITLTEPIAKQYLDKLNGNPNATLFIQPYSPYLTYFLWSLVNVELAEPPTMRAAAAPAKIEATMLCEHLKGITEVKLAEKHECEECVKIGAHWVHLRTCQTCGVTLCCDSSPNRHARHHAHDAGHPVCASAEPGERWVYCFTDDQMAEY